MSRNKATEAKGHLKWMRQMPTQQIVFRCSPPQNVNTLRSRQNGHNIADGILEHKNTFSWMKLYGFRLICHWSLFLRELLTIFQHWFTWWLGAVEATIYGPLCCYSKSYAGWQLRNQTIALFILFLFAGRAEKPRESADEFLAQTACNSANVTMPWCILSSVWVRLSIFSQLSIIQYIGLCVFSLLIYFLMILMMYTLSHHHHQIGSMNCYPSFRVRSWNNGMRCMSFYSLMWSNLNV